jgi:hypothetical protein
MKDYHRGICLGTTPWKGVASIYAYVEMIPILSVVVCKANRSSGMECKQAKWFYCRIHQVLCTALMNSILFSLFRHVQTRI